MKMENKFKGAGVALVTPFDEAGAVDFDTLRRLVDSVVEGGVDFIVALGTTAETPTLTNLERGEVARCIRERNAGRVPLVIGMGGNDTMRLCAELRGFDPEGFDAVLSSTPYYNKPSQEGLFRHYKAVAEASPLPVILYNVPARTGVNMSAETTLRIAAEVPGVIGIKEACGEISQMQDIIKGAPEGFLVLSGDDAMTLPLMSVGGHGVISVLANALPEQFSRMVHTAQTESVARAQAIWADLEDVCHLLFAEGNPTGVKVALEVRGVCRAGVRLPLVEGSSRLREALKEALGRVAD
ncbi:MAG: 4-hydroxy-tetrahydrodipicolinate synthase [Alistipes sp.]|jgi:4-hydroxy-tetrahydrodipicolinate synthase|nr:4-hydroxy-tetrahydrodipicolinate synthase [Alistipes sp.]